MHQLVIARYAENLDWLDRVPPEFEVHVYNKGAPITSAAAVARATRISSRPNEGRESETYLFHTASLASVPTAKKPADPFVVFAQGDPFEHSPDFLALLGAWGAWADVQPLSWRWKVRRDIPPASVLARETGGFVEGLRVRPELFSLQSWTPLGFHDVGTFWLQETYRQVHGLPDGTNIAAHFLAMCGLGNLAAQADANLLGRFSYGAVFAARRSHIRAVPAEALAKLRRAALGHEVYGYVLERLWLHLFGLPFTQPALLPVRAPAAFEHSFAGPAFVPPDRTSPGRKRVRKLVGRMGKLMQSVRG